LLKAARTDYHIHPDYSIDAAPASIKDYCYRALELGLKDMCFTTHIELDPVRKEVDNFVRINGEKVSVFDLSWLDKYFDDIFQAQKEFGEDNLRIKAGIEVGYCPGCEKFVEKITENYPFDFVLGAIHCLDHIAISSTKESPTYFKYKSLSQFRTEYFYTLKEAVATGLFDAIAHIDIYQRYCVGLFGSEILKIHVDAIEPIFEEMARRNMGLEINTSSRRRGLQEFHPAREIIALATQLGVNIFTIGSDAHALEHLGGYLDEAQTLLEEFNLVNHVYSRRHAIPYTSNLPNSGKKEY